VRMRKETARGAKDRESQVSEDSAVDRGCSFEGARGNFASTGGAGKRGAGVVVVPRL